MRTYIILIGIFAWITWGVLWVLPMKRKLQKIHGFDKTNHYFLELAKQDNSAAKLLKKRTHIVMVVGIISGLIITLTKYF